MQARRRCHDADVGGHGEGDADADSGAVDSGQDRLLALDAHDRQEGVKLVLARWWISAVAVVGLARLAEVEAGAERIAVARQRQRPDVGVGGAGAHRIVDRLEERAVEGVFALRAVEAQDAQVVVVLDVQDSRWHASQDPSRAARLLRDAHRWCVPAVASALEILLEVRKPKLASSSDALSSGGGVPRAGAAAHCVARTRSWSDVSSRPVRRRLRRRPHAGR